MPLIIIADENDGRRNLLGSSIERAGYEVTRASTLKQCEATALATMPEVVLIDGEWKTSDAIDTAGRLTSDPEFELKSRVVILSRDTSNEYLVNAGRAGVSEVLGKPVDMGTLLEQLTKHANKMKVPPPGGVKIGKGGGGLFDIDLIADEPAWALPILEDLLGGDVIDTDFVNELLAGLELQVDGLDSHVVERLLRAAFEQLIHAAEVNTSGEDEEEVDDDPMSKAAVASSRMLKAMEKLANSIEDDIEQSLENLMEMPDEVAILTEATGLQLVDPNALYAARMTLEVVHDLLFELSIAGRLVDVTLTTQVQAAAEMTKEALDALPEAEIESEDDTDDVADANADTDIDADADADNISDEANSDD
jgi:CheY-like chemotaxis protein